MEPDCRLRRWWKGRSFSQQPGKATHTPLQFTETCECQFATMQSVPTTALTCTHCMHFLSFPHICWRSSLFFQPLGCHVVVTLLPRCCHAVATLPRCCHAASWRCASLFRSASRKLSMRRLDRGDRDRTVKFFLCETNLVRWKKVKKTQTPAEQAWWYLMMFDVTHCMLYTVYINTSILYNLYNLYNMYI